MDPFAEIVIRQICLPTNGASDEELAALVKDSLAHVRDIHVYRAAPQNSTVRLQYLYESKDAKPLSVAAEFYPGPDGAALLDDTDGAVRPLERFEMGHKDRRDKIKKEMPHTRLAVQAITGGWLAFRCGWAHEKPAKELKKYVYAYECDAWEGGQMFKCAWPWTDKTSAAIESARTRLEAWGKSMDAKDHAHLRKTYAEDMNSPDVVTGQKPRQVTYCFGTSLVGTAFRFGVTRVVEDEIQLKARQERFWPHIEKASEEGVLALCKDIMNVPDTELTDMLAHKGMVPDLPDSDGGEDEEEAPEGAEAPEEQESNGKEEDKRKKQKTADPSTP